jgi:hypothetical protein
MLSRVVSAALACARSTVSPAGSRSSLIWVVGGKRALTPCG